MISISAGTANVLGLKAFKSDTNPTTAYLLLGENCQGKCSFCSQALTQTKGSRKLSRIVWPVYPVDTVLQRLEKKTVFERICLQLTNDKHSFLLAEKFLKSFKGLEPVCLCANFQSLEEIALYLKQGATQITVPLDAVNPEKYKTYKGGEWEDRITFLERAVKRFPGQIGTHLILGLGENEEETIGVLLRLLEQGIKVALFAFTPIKGTPLGGLHRPNLLSYRRIQVAFWLLNEKKITGQEIRFSGTGVIESFGKLSNEEFKKSLKGGQAFETSGCQGCNRPYYNEQPGGVMYNYPRPLTEAEFKQETDLVWDSLKGVKNL